MGAKDKPQAKTAGPPKGQVEYRVVAGDNLEAFEQIIEDLLNDDWQPCANLIVVFSGPSKTQMMLVREMIKIPRGHTGLVAVPTGTRRGH